MTGACDAAGGNSQLDMHPHRCSIDAGHPLFHRCPCGFTWVVLPPGGTVGERVLPVDSFRKDDDGKTWLGCLPPIALKAVGRVLTFGGKKYGRENWHKNRSRARYYDATLRHLFAWWAGEDRDEETRESHLAHAVCCLLFLLELEERGLVEDDRPFKGDTP